MPASSDVLAVVAQVTSKIDLAGASLSDEYYYQSLPLCVIDAVFSISVKYCSTRQVVIRYCDYTSQQRIRDVRFRGGEFPPTESQESISSFCARAEQIDSLKMATEVYQNRQRTSARSGILKAEAVLRFAEVLRSHGVEFLQDIPEAAKNKDLAGAVRAIPGQGSGVSLLYFWMLAGSDDFIKPDRMILRFVSSAISREVRIDEATELLRAAAYELSTTDKPITPRLLDYAVWSYQRTQPVA